jgi:CubicO group peptidase (beta-lactamase class C family)
MNPILRKALIGIFCAYLILFITSCNFSTKQSVSLLYDITKPTPIDTNYFHFLNNNCENWYQHYFKGNQFNGGIVVAKSGNIVFEKYNGVAHLGKSDTINIATPFHIASTSKTFTAMAVLKLFENKLLNLDDQFSRFFPEFNYPGITIRMLLNHRSGLPNYVYFFDELKWDKKKFITNQDVLNSLINNKSLLKVNPPGMHFAYCNTNYVLLALLIEKITKTSYPSFIRKTIFEPSGMKNTFVYTDADSSKTNPSYDWKNQEQAFINLDKVYGDKNIFSTPRDLLIWDRLLISNQFLKASTLAEAYSPYSNEKNGIKNYGLGWRMYLLPNNNKIIYHNGWWHGSNAVFIRLLKEDATIIVIGNKFNKNIYKAKELVSLFINNYKDENEEE